MRVCGLAWRVEGFRVVGLGFRVQGSGFRIQAWCRVLEANPLRGDYAHMSCRSPQGPAFDLFGVAMLPSPLKGYRAYWIRRCNTERSQRDVDLNAWCSVWTLTCSGPHTQGLKKLIQRKESGSTSLTPPAKGAGDMTKSCNHGTKAASQRESVEAKVLVLVYSDSALG